MPRANDRRKRAGDLLFPPPRRDSQLSPYLRLNTKRRASLLLPDLFNGIRQQVIAAAPVHVMLTPGCAAEFGRLGVAAGTQHIEEGKRGGAEHRREVAEGRAEIWTRRSVYIN